MQGANNIRQLINTLIFVAFFGGVYYAVTYMDFFATARLTTADVEKKTTDVEQAILNQLNDIAAIQLSGAIFTNKEFKSLEDVSVVLPRPQVDRTDPFAAY